MYGTGPVAQAAAYHAAGVRLQKVAPILGLRVDQVSALLLGFWLHEARDQDPTFALVNEPGLCRIQGCGKPVMHLRLCVAHVSRYYAGRPLLGGGRRGRQRRIRVEACVVCGVTWCRTGGYSRATCSPECSRRAAGRRNDSAALRARDEAIITRIGAGEPYRDIAADYGLTDRRIGQMARAAGLRRYRRRSDAGKSKGPRRR
jgi:hypothetical protein